MNNREELQKTPQTGEPEQPPKPRRFSNNALVFRAVAAGYLIYLGYKMAKDTVNAPKTDFPPWLSYVLAGVFVIAGAFFLITSYLHYRENRRIEAEEANQAAAAAQNEAAGAPAELDEPAEDAAAFDELGEDAAAFDELEEEAATSGESDEPEE